MTTDSDTAKKLKYAAERIEDIKEAVKTEQEPLKDLLKNLKDQGFDVDVIKVFVKLRGMTPEKRTDWLNSFDSYRPYLILEEQPALPLGNPNSDRDLTKLAERLHEAGVRAHVTESGQPSLNVPIPTETPVERYIDSVIETTPPNTDVRQYHRGVAASKAGLTLESAPVVDDTVTYADRQQWILGWMSGQRSQGKSVGDADTILLRR